MVDRVMLNIRKIIKIVFNFFIPLHHIFIIVSSLTDRICEVMGVTISSNLAVSKLMPRAHALNIIIKIFVTKIGRVETVGFSWQWISGAAAPKQQSFRIPISMRFHRASPNGDSGAITFVTPLVTLKLRHAYNAIARTKPTGAELAKRKEKSTGANID